MGMYTELVLGVEMACDLPEQVVDVLSYMVGDKTEEPTPPALHTLFATPRWAWMLRSDSYYFAGDTMSTFRYDDTGRDWTLTVRCNLKNYDNEIALFLDWLLPFTATEGFVGYFRYEEDEQPTLIFNPERVS